MDETTEQARAQTADRLARLAGVFDAAAIDVREIGPPVVAPRANSGGAWPKGQPARPRASALGVDATAAAATWQLPVYATFVGLTLAPASSLTAAGDWPLHEPPLVVWNNPADPADPSRDAVTLPAVWTAYGELLWTGRITELMQGVVPGLRPALDRADFAISSVANYGAIVNHLLGLQEWLSTRVGSGPVGEVRRTYRPALGRVEDVLSDHITRLPAYLGDVLAPTEAWAAELPESHTTAAPSTLGAW